jgi:hypothetical protein
MLSLRDMSPFPTSPSKIRTKRLFLHKLCCQERVFYAIHLQSNSIMQRIILCCIAAFYLSLNKKNIIAFDASLTLLSFATTCTFHAL